jgi:hypothetical protein
LTIQLTRAACCAASVDPGKAAHVDSVIGALLARTVSSSMQYVEAVAPPGSSTSMSTVRVLPRGISRSNPRSPRPEYLPSTGSAVAA